MKKIALSIFTLLILISGCASTTKANVACDFVVGAADNALERHENKNKSTIHGETVKSNGVNDSVAGIFSVLFGAINRSVDSNNKQDCR